MASSVNQPASKPDARRERWRAHREARRAEFVEAAIRTIERLGAEVGMEDVAREAGVSKPVIYRHFADKADLYFAVSQRGWEMLMERMDPALAKGGPMLQWINAVIDSYLSCIEDHPKLYGFVVRRTFTDQPLDTDPVSNDRTMIATSLARLLGNWMRMFGVDSGGAEPWAFGVVGMVQASGDWWLERNSMSRGDLAEYLTSIIWHAVAGYWRATANVTLDPTKSVAGNLALVEDARAAAGADEAADPDADRLAPPIRLVPRPADAAEH